MNEINSLNDKIVYFVKGFSVNFPNWPFTTTEKLYYDLAFNDIVSRYDIRLIIYRER